MTYAGFCVGLLQRLAIGWLTVTLKTRPTPPVLPPRFDGTHDGVWSLALGLGSWAWPWPWPWPTLCRACHALAQRGCGARLRCKLANSNFTVGHANFGSASAKTASSQQQRPAKQAWFCIHVHFPSYFSSGFSSRNTACVADHLRRQYTDVVLTRARADKTGLIYPARVAWCF